MEVLEATNLTKANTNILKDLNEEQKKAVTAPFGNLLVLAGAGSGKTRVLVHRIAWLVENMGASLNNIIAVTFTNKAAAEMKERIENILNMNVRGMWVGTFHGLAHKMLRTHTEYCNLPKNFQIIDSDDQLRVIKKILKEKNIPDSIVEPKSIQYYINRKKDEGKRANPSEIFVKELDNILSNVYYVYEQICKEGGLVDFAEILLKSYELLNNNPEILKHYQLRFSHFLVDEFQDTNTIQYSWLKLLAKKSASLTIVGDDDQSIYGWRGAQIENLYKFEKHFPNVELIRLEQNYRSTDTILKAANAVIDNNESRLGKTLWTESKPGEPITLFVAENEEKEALFVIKHLKQHIDLGGSLSDVAILYRSNAQSRVIEEALVRSGLPYKIYGGLRFFERAEIKDALAYLKLAINKEDNHSFERVVNLPNRGIGEKSLEKIREISNVYRKSLWDAAIDALNQNILPGKASCGLREFLSVVTNVSQSITEKSLTEVVDDLINKSGLLLFFKNQKGERAQSKVENLEELVNATADFVPSEENASFEEYNILTLNEFLAYTSLEAGDYVTNNSSQAVQLMTLHASKGLEFNVVFICGLEEGLFPSHFSKDSDTGIEEERRLCYVGITRAQEKLFLTYANYRRLFGRVELRRPSRFTKEIPKNLLDKQGRLVSINYSHDNFDYYSKNNDHNYSSGYDNRKGYSNKNNYYEKNTYSNKNSCYSSTFSSKDYYAKSSSDACDNNISKNNIDFDNDPFDFNVDSNISIKNKINSNMGISLDNNEFSLGCRVNHKKFGKGVIIEMEGNGHKARVRIKFDAVGIKWLVLEYANLEKV